jgi:hypothetical protein
VSYRLEVSCVSTVQRGALPSPRSDWPEDRSGGRGLFSTGRVSGLRTKAHAALTGGTLVTIRAAVPYDTPMLADLYRRCTPRSLSQRHVGFPLGQLPGPERWTDPPPDRAARCVLVAYAGERLVGVAEITGHRPIADIGVLIREDHRRRGLGAILTRQSLHVAHLLGYTEMVAFGTPDNPALRATLARLELERHTRYTGDLLVTRAPLPHSS